MKFHSIPSGQHPASFAEAIRAGLAPDRGLYFPDAIPQLDRSSWLDDEHNDLPALATKILSPFAGDALSAEDLQALMEDALDFPIELRALPEWFAGCHVLELFHGPTAAFKDVGARVMSRLLGALTSERLTVLVATSGDTGSAVAQGFLNVPGIDVVILYPSGRISEIQEKQLTTVGNNVVALEVEGSFDECQTMVKSAFLDSDIQRARPLTSANSINLARWIPQAVYYAYATHLLGQAADFVVPSGNFGNLAAGVLAAQMGMPAGTFIAATNANDVIPAYLRSGRFQARPSEPTLSNAMDVGDPSNRPRLEALLGGTAGLQAQMRAESIDDPTTLATMKAVHDATGELVCPHTAVGLEVARRHASRSDSVRPVVVLATAHPAKFGDVVLAATGESPVLPDALKAAAVQEKKSIRIAPNDSALKDYLLS